MISHCGLFSADKISFWDQASAARELMECPDNQRIGWSVKFHSIMD
jgi:hypothetical protein